MEMKPRKIFSQLGWALELEVSVGIHCLTVDCDWGESVTIRKITGEEITGTRLNQSLADLDRIALYRKRYLDGDKNYVIASVEEGLNHVKSRAKIV